MGIYDPLKLCRRCAKFKEKVPTELDQWPGYCLQRLWTLNMAKTKNRCPFFEAKNNADQTLYIVLE